MTGRPGRIAEDHKLLLHTIERPSDGFKWAGPQQSAMTCIGERGTNHGTTSSRPARRSVIAAAVGSRRCARSGAAQGGASATARAAAAYDITGYWVSEVTEKWRYRMVVPDKGDYVQVPLNPEGRKVANAWDPARDQASGEACRSYGAAAPPAGPGAAAHLLAGRQHAPSGYGFRDADAPVPFRRVTAAECERRRGRDTRWRCGAEANRGIGVTARAGLCRIRRAGWSSHQRSGRKRTISR